MMLCAGIGFLLWDRLRRRHHHYDHVGAINNARQIGLALFEFETAYGRFPDASTITDVKENSPSSAIPLGTTSSNDFFRQLLVAEIAGSEGMFYAKSPMPGSRRPDNVFVGTRALEKGECGFAYIAGLTSSHPPETPIIVCPLVPGKRIFDYKFCKKYFDGKAVILRMDNSVTTMPVDPSGKVFIKGKDLFDPTQPFWMGKAPDVKWPE